MLRILQLGMTDNLGGIETFLINYYRNIDKSKIQFDFVNIYPNDLCFQNEIEQMGGKVYKVSNYYKHPIKYIKQVKKIIEDNSYTVIHCNMNSAVMLYPLIAAKMANVKVIIAHSHNSSGDKGIIKTLLHSINKHFIPLFATHFFACSKLAGEWFFSKKIINSSKFKIIYNAIDIKKFKFDENIRKNKREQLGIKDNTFVVGHVGRFNKQKNHLFLIEIFNEVYKINNNVKLLLIGIGPLQYEIKEKVKKLGLTNNVIFLNNRNDVNELMSVMDVFIFPSLYEGLGTVLIEAQASGLVCLASKNIPKLANVSDRFYQMSLNEPARNWANKALSININKRNISSKIRVFDVEKCAIELSEFYKNNSKIKICHFVNGIVNGGVERVLINYFSNIEDRYKYELHIVTQGNSDSKCLREFQKMGFKIHTVTRKKDSLYKNYKDIRNILKNTKFDIIHAHMSSTNFFPLFYSYLSGVKIRISHSHLVMPNISKLEKLYIKAGKLFDTDRFACSREAAISLFNTENNVIILNNAINLEDFRYRQEIRNNYRNQLKIEEDEVVIGHVGRFVEQKNHKFIIEVFNELVKRNNRYKLILIGIGELKEEIKERVKKLDIEKNILFLDSRNDVNNVMQAMDIFILPSLFEGLGIVLIEAQSIGLKCFASDNIPKEVKVTENIRLLKLDKKIWINEIEKISNYEINSFIEEISNKGFNIKIEAKKLDNLYKKMVRRR
ncbi:hypothetical protein I3900191A7_25060 [Clostridium baratii]|uniref:glycosyltransferase n=1 Tax=Clostridium baratii TaxID=1561 RepID=UPI001C031A2B|nr:glycosyltransferase [Clostridium baratii]MBT9830473.1 glycosyltransferase [Clostridium baratii]MDY3207550.1 glycosyltransferase [Clostridium baratii]